MNSETWKNIKIIENESISTKICGTKPRRIPAGTTSQEAINHTKSKKIAWQYLSGIHQILTEVPFRTSKCLISTMNKRRRNNKKWCTAFV